MCHKELLANLTCIFTFDLSRTTEKAKRTINEQLSDFGVEVYSITITNVQLPPNFTYVVIEPHKISHKFAHLTLVTRHEHIITKIILSNPDISNNWITPIIPIILTIQTPTHSNQMEEATTFDSRNKKQEVQQVYQLQVIEDDETREQGKER